MRTWKKIVIWTLAALFLIDGVYLLIYSLVNVGTAFVLAIAFGFSAYGIFYQKIDTFCKKGIGRILKYLFFSAGAVFLSLFLFLSISGLSNTAKGNEKAIIVLGAGLKNNQIGEPLRYRLETALSAWEENPDAILVVTGGTGAKQTISEASAMKRWLLDHDVPEEKILVEDKSTSTETNFQLSADLLLKNGINPSDPLVVVTNAFHSYRARGYAEKAGFTDIYSIPAGNNPFYYVPSCSREVFAVLEMWLFR